MVLRGMTWSHDRGLKPLLEATKQFKKIHPDVEIEWDARSLSDFELFPIEELTAQYDFVMIDHPHIGVAYEKKLLHYLDEMFEPEFLRDQEDNSVGLSYQSYNYEGHQLALAVDSAAQFSAYRKDIIDEMDTVIPGTWDQVYQLAKSLSKGQEMAIPFVPVHAYSSFFSLCSQITDKPFWSNGEALGHEVGVNALKILTTLLSLSHKDSYQMNPIDVLDRMSQEDEIVYAPLIYGYSTYSEEGYNKHRIKFDDMPSDTCTPNGSMIGGVGLSISTTCKSLDIAVDFVKLVASEAFQKGDFVNHFGQPGHRQAWVDEAVNERSFGFYKDTLETMEYGSMRPRFNGYIEFQAEAGSLIRDYIKAGHDDHKTFVDRLNDLFFKVYNKSIKKKSQALEGIKVLDFSQLLAGPYAAMMLGDMGADIIKIERLEKGDLYREMTFANQFIEGEVSPPFLAWNRNKRSVSLDLKDDQVKEVIYEMVKTADMVIHNFRPGVMERLGYGYETLKGINKRVIYGSNSGFGPDGPYHKRPGQDLLAQGLSGIMSLTGRGGMPPSSIGTGLADHLSAYHLVYGLLSALYSREQTGLGQKVEVDLFRSMLSFMNQELVTVMNTDIEVNRPKSGIALPFLDAPYGVYTCKDGHITIAMNDFAKLVKVLGDESLLEYSDPSIRYEKRDEIFHKIEAITKMASTKHWLEVMLAEDLWVSKVNHIEEVAKDPQVIHMDLMKSYKHKVAGEIKVVGPAVTMSETQPKVSKAPPLVGEHSVEVLKEFGIDDAVISGLLDSGALYNKA